MFLRLFSSVRGNDLQVGVAVEDTSKDQSDELDAGLIVPPQTERRKGRVDRLPEACYYYSRCGNCNGCYGESSFASAPSWISRELPSLSKVL